MIEAHGVSAGKLERTARMGESSRPTLNFERLAPMEGVNRRTEAPHENRGEADRLDLAGDSGKESEAVVQTREMKEADQREKTHDPQLP